MALWHPDRGGWRDYRRCLWRRVPLLLVSRPEWYGEYRRWFLYDEGQCLFVPVMDQDLLITTNVSTQTYTSKANWNNISNIVQVIGGGGAGAIGASTSTGGGGGGGGAYNSITGFVFATPGTTTATYQVTAGLLHGGSFPGTAPDCWFNGANLAASSVGAKGGLSPATSTTAAGGTGGLASAGVPTTSPPGRNGGTGGSGASATAGGGGGGAGGPSGVGAAGSGTAPGSGDGGVTPAGAAGNPGTSNAGTQFSPVAGSGSGGGGSNASGGTGGPGGRYGGGAGGGSRSTGVGGDGFQGIVALTWAVEALGAEIFRVSRRAWR